MANPSAEVAGQGVGLGNQACVIFAVNEVALVEMSGRALVREPLIPWMVNARVVDLVKDQEAPFPRRIFNKIHYAILFCPAVA
jgi:hypothetical protein